MTSKMTPVQEKMTAMTAISRLSRRTFIACSLGCAMFASSLAQAQLSIEITGAGASRIPVAIADFAGDDPMSRIVTGTVRGDLERSGLFKMVDTTGAALDENTPVDYGAWKNRGADALAAGSLVRSSTHTRSTPAFRVLREAYCPRAIRSMAAV